MNPIAINCVLRESSQTAGTGSGLAKHLKGSVMMLMTGRTMRGREGKTASYKNGRFRV